MSGVRGYAGAARTVDGRGGIVSTCIACGAYCPKGESYCPRHRPIPRARKLRGGGATITKFRAEVLALAGNRCEAVIDGERCDVTDRAQLEAHHIGGLVHNDAGRGVCLCRAHHRLVEAQIAAQKLSA